MSEEARGAEVQAPRWRRRLVITAVVLLAAVLIASRVFYMVPGLNLLSARGRHERALDQISAVMVSSMEAIRAGRSTDPSNWPVADDRVRYSLLSAMQKSVWNVFFYPEPPASGKVRAIADRLQATGAADLRTVEGCFEIFALFEDASPRFREYGPALEIYTLQTEGRLPAPPVRK